MKRFELLKQENHKHDGFGNMIKHLHKLAKLSPLFSPEVRICLRSYIKHSHSAAPRFSTSVLCVSQHDQTLMRVFHTLLRKPTSQLFNAIKSRYFCVRMFFR